MRSLMYSLRKYSAFTNDEIIQIIVTAIIGGFFFSFNKWGFDEFSYSVGIQNLIIQTLLILIILFSMIIAQKVMGIFFGYKITYKYSWLGLILGLFITGFSNGFLPFVIPGGIDYKKIKTLRMGQFLSDYKYSELFLITSLSTIIPLVWVSPLGAIYLMNGSLMVKYLIITCLLISIYSLIPVPRLLSPKEWNFHGISDLKPIKLLRGGSYGYDLFCFSMNSYIILSFWVLTFCGLVYLFQIYSFILAMILGLILLGVYKLVINYLKN